MALSIDPSNAITYGTGGNGYVTGNYYTTTAGTYCSMAGSATTYSPKKSKQSLICYKCKTLIAEVYSFPIGDMMCKPCYLLEKLIE